MSLCSVNQICLRPRSRQTGLPRFPANAAHAGGGFPISAAMRSNNFRDLTGSKFNKLTALELASTNPTVWLCRCECGNLKKVHGSHLTRGKTQSCGCWRKEVSSKLNITHGRYCGTGANKREASSYKFMISRCTDASDKDFPNYGGRGIKVCAAWMESFNNFLTDMGNKPTPKHTIERKDSNGNYEPSNCIWALNKDQQNNRRNNHILELNGISKTVAQWSDDLKITREVIHGRLRLGWTVDKTLTMPVAFRTKQIK